jgi:hypothetical protein
VIAARHPHQRAARAARFTIPAAGALVVAAEELRTALADGALEPGRRAARAAGHAWVESILDGLVLTLAAAARGPGAGRRTAGMIRDLAAKVTEGSVARLSLLQLDALGAFLGDHLDASAATIELELEGDTAERILAGLAPEVGDQALAAALRTTIDVTLARLLDAPLALLGLGVVMRTALRLGRGAIGSRIHGEVDRAVQQDDARARLRAMLAGFVVELRDDAPTR